jgi:hypothetical protein
LRVAGLRVWSFTFDLLTRSPVPERADDAAPIVAMVRDVWNPTWNVPDDRSSSGDQLIATRAAWCLLTEDGPPARVFGGFGHVPIVRLSGADVN